MTSRNITQNVPDALRRHNALEHYSWSRGRNGGFFSEYGVGEPLSQYKKGGYHPIDIGDTLLDERYTIVNKVGWGRDAITWLAKDSR